jgi:ankyrin repeat protein
MLLKACADKKQALVALLHRAASEGKELLVQELLKQGIDSNGQNCLGETALFFAVDAVHTPIVKILLARGADPTIRSPHRQFSSYQKN